MLCYDENNYALLIWRIRDFKYADIVDDCHYDCKETGGRGEY